MTSKMQILERVKKLNKSRFSTNILFQSERLEKESFWYHESLVKILYKNHTISICGELEKKLPDEKFFPKKHMKIENKCNIERTNKFFYIDGIRSRIFKVTDRRCSLPSTKTPKLPEQKTEVVHSIHLVGVVIIATQKTRASIVISWPFDKL